MEVDDFPLPEYPSEHEDMVVDLVLAEVRQHVTSQQQDCEGQAGRWFPGNQSDLPVTSHPPQSLVVVVDTNVIISDLPFLNNLKDEPIEGYGLPTLVIPWIVLQELDTLKMPQASTLQKMSLGTQMKARKGIAFLQACFRQKHPRVWGQTPKQAQEAASQLSATNNDDRILQACLQYQQQWPSAFVVLLTNDNNLINKALVCGMEAYKRSGIISALTSRGKEKSKVQAEQGPLIVSSPGQPLGTGASQGPDPWNSSQQMIPSPRQADPIQPPPVPSDSNCIPQSQTINSNIPNVPSDSATLFSQQASVVRGDKKNSSHTAGQVNSGLAECPVSSQHSNHPALQAGTSSGAAVAVQTATVRHSSPDLQPNDSCTMDGLVDAINGKLTKLLREALGKTLETEMRLAYEDIWEEIVYRKPPWSLEDILESMKKHWRAVFGFIFPRNLLVNVETLIKLFDFETERTLESIAMATESALSLLEKCVERNMYGRPMHQITRCVSCLKTLCEELSLGNLTPALVGSLEGYLSEKLNALDKNPVKVKEVTINNNHIVVPESVRPAPVTTPGTPVTPAAPMTSAGSPLPDTRLEGITTLTTQTSSHPGQPNSTLNPSNLITKARGKLQKIWEQIYKYCQDLGGVMNNLDRVAADILNNVQFLLQRLVPMVKEIRLQLAKLLEFPPSDVSKYEEEFHIFSSHCQNFFKGLHAVDELPEVDRMYFLAIFGDPSQRESLSVFLSQLDEMACHLYNCVRHLAESGLG